MSTSIKTLSLVALGIGLSHLCSGANQLTIRAVNPLAFARANQTIELSAKKLAPLGEKNLQKIHVRDAAGREVLCQAVDTDYDDFHQPDIVIFQADFAANETKTFSVVAGRKQEYTPADFKAYGRFVRERFDDFAWENDHIAHRTYGKALETWKGEPLTSSAIDVWSKRVSRPVIDEWYMVDNYHSDMGEGCDDYSAGATRGCGGNGLWSNSRIWVSKNFVNSRVLANGPIRVMFELDYEPFDVNGMEVSEVKRITLDAGSQLDHFQSSYKIPSGAGTLICAAGLKKVNGEELKFNADLGTYISWEPMEKNLGMQGVALIVNPKMLHIEKQADDKLNNLVLIKTGPDLSVSYWAGFAWDRAGRITTQTAWTDYVNQFAQGLASPIEVTVAGE
jgi:hypothetical protein